MSIILTEIDDIDKETPWSEVEPSWWLDMMEIRRSLQKTANQEWNVAVQDSIDLED